MKKILLLLALWPFLALADDTGVMPGQHQLKNGQAAFINKPNTFTKPQTVNGNLNLIGGNYQISGTQIACANLSNGATGCSTATGTSGATIPLLNGANTWSGVQTFTNSDIALLGSSTGVTTFTSANSSGSNFTITVPAATDTLDLLGTAQTITALKTFSGGIYQSAKAAEEAVYSNGNSGTSLALNIDNGNLQSTTITGAVAITLTAPTHPGKTLVILTQDGSGHVYSISGCKWAGGTAITYSTAASKIDLISIAYDGTNFYCMGGAAFS